MRSAVSLSISFSIILFLSIIICRFRCGVVPLSEGSKEILAKQITCTARPQTLHEKGAYINHTFPSDFFSYGAHNRKKSHFFFKNPHEAMAEVYHIVAKHSVAKVRILGCNVPEIMDEKEFTVTKKVVSPVTVVDVLRDLGLSYEDILIGKIDANIPSLALDNLFPPQATVQFQKLYQASSAMTVGYRLTIHVEKVEAVE